MIYVQWKLVIIKPDGLEELEGELSPRLDSWEVESESSRHILQENHKIVLGSSWVQRKQKQAQDRTSGPSYLGTSNRSANTRE